MRALHSTVVLVLLRRYILLVPLDIIVMSVVDSEFRIFAMVLSRMDGWMDGCAMLYVYTYVRVTTKRIRPPNISHDIWFIHERIVDIGSTVAYCTLMPWFDSLEPARATTGEIDVSTSKSIERRQLIIPPSSWGMNHGLRRHATWFSITEGQ